MTRNDGQSRREHSRVLIFYDRPDEFLDELRQRFPGVEFATCTTYAELNTALGDFAPGIVLAYKFESGPFPREVILSCPTLKWLSVGFAGIDHVVPWDDSRLVVTTAAGVAAPEMAQYAVAATYGLFQRFPQFFRQQAERRWSFELIRSARNASVGLFGLGHAGTAIARSFRALGHSVVACRARPGPSDDVDAIYPMDRLGEMLGSVDVVIVCAALTPVTRDLFGAEQFSAMRRGAFFINIARGALVQEQALMDALSSGQLGGSVIDVARTEPLPPNSPLWDAPNLLITPHTCSEYEGWFRDAAMMFADNLERWIAGETLQNRASPDRGY